MNAIAQLSKEQRQRCEVWTRVMGYHRPVSAFNAGKQSEHSERLHFNETPQDIKEMTKKYGTSS